MQQRVNLARALAIDPEMLLLDEPFAALDAQTREFMQLELLRVWSEARKTAVFITHDIKEAVYLADRVVVFSARPGRVRQIYEIDLPRPRSLSIKREQQFLAYEDAIWGCIEEEVIAAIEGGLAAKA
jgi:NitT/TauT family transport system ATP-binding protein